MKAYPQDLRQRILDTVHRGDGSLRQIARRFLVSLSFVTRLLQFQRSIGSLVPRPHGGGNPAVLGPNDLGSQPEDGPITHADEAGEP
jgi:transposase